MNPPVPPDHVERRDAVLAGLLAERSWLRRVARALVHDEHEADDLEQSVWAAALARPPTQAHSPRGWLATVLRRLRARRVRGAVRLRARERGAARAEALPDTAALVAEAELQRRVLEAVLALPADLREAVLLRHHQGLEVASVAERQGVPLETARTRLRRGLAAVRAHLDASHGGERHAWRGALQAFAGTAALGRGVGVGAASTAGGVVMASKAWVVGTALVALGAGGWMLARRVADSDLPPVRGLPADPSPGPGSAPRLQGAAPARAEASAPPVPLAAEDPVASVRLRGRVTLPDGGPAAAARLRLERPTGRSYEATTDDAGAFLLLAGPPPGEAGEWLGLTAAQGDLVGTVGVFLPPGGSAAPPRTVRLTLGRATPIRARVVAQGRPVPGARVALQAMPRGFPAPVLEASSDAQGRVALGAWPRGTYRLLAAAPHGGRAQAWCVLPYETDEVTLAVGAGRDLRVRVLEQGTDRPVAGATVRVYEDLSDATRGVTPVPYAPAPAVAPTDAAGETLLSGLDERAEVLVVAEVAGAKPADANLLMGDAYRVEPWPADGLVIRTVILRSERRWKVEAGEVPVPPDGTRVLVRSASNNLLTGGAWTAQGEVRGGWLSAPCFFHEGIFALAQTPDGLLARLLWQPNQEAGTPTSFRRPRSVEVRVRREDGSPAAGVRVQVGASLEGPGAPRATDGAGLARFEGFWGRRQRVSVLRPGEAAGEGAVDPVGEVDLEPGSAAVEVTIGAERDVILTGEVDGRPGLPPGLTAFCWAPLSTDEADLRTGVLRLKVRAQVGRKEAHLLLGGPGVRSVQRVVPVDGTEAPFDLHVVFERQVDLGARVVPPPDGRSAVRLERWDADLSAWVVEPARGEQGPAEAAVRLLSSAAPGRHRLVDTLSGAVGPEGEVSASAPAPLLRLDLSDVVVVGGQVTGPEGSDLSLAQVVTEGAGPAPAPGPPPPPTPGVPVLAPPAEAAPLRVDAAGRFQVRLPRGSARTLIVRHPHLTADPEAGRALVDGTGPVRLALLEGATALLTFDPAAAPQADRPAQAWLFAGQARGVPVSTHPLAWGPGGARFSGYRPGTYTLWLDVPPFAPTVLSAVTLGPGRTDLGRVALAAGARVRVRVVPAAGQPAPSVNVAAYAEDPKHWRAVGAQDGTQPIELSGLARGPYRLMVSLSRSGETVLDEPLVVQGSEVVERVVTLR